MLIIYFKANKKILQLEQFNLIRVMNHNIYWFIETLLATQIVSVEILKQHLFSTI